MTFLKEEGFAPNLDEDSDIKFKSEGETHWIRILSESPFFIVFSRAGYTLEGEDGLKRSASISACNDTNEELFAVKLYCSETMVHFNIEQYTQSAEDFKYVFYKNLQRLADAEEQFLEKYYSF